MHTHIFDHGLSRWNYAMAVIGGPGGVYLKTAVFVLLAFYLSSLIIQSA